MAFVHVGTYHINLDHVSHWTDNGTVVDVYVHGQKIGAFSDMDAQVFRAAAEAHKPEVNQFQHG